MRDYNPLVIPAENSSEALEVFVGLTLSQIVDIVSWSRIFKQLGLCTARDFKHNHIEDDIT